MYYFNDAIYIKKARGYVKCILHKNMLTEPTTYYLAETKVVVPELPEQYDVLTMAEIAARYGDDAVTETTSRRSKED